MTDSVATTAEDYSSDDDFLGHPKGLYVCFTTELWERFSFYGMKFLLVLYLTKYHLFTDEMGLDVLRLRFWGVVHITADVQVEVVCFDDF